ncbi:MAG: HEAT repeat domain-containing protein [Gemmatimonadales bacterium]
MTWLLTYAAHSTILLAGAWLLSRRLRSHVAREVLWKTALFGGFITATAQMALGLTPLAGRLTMERPAVLVAAVSGEVQPDPAPITPPEGTAEDKVSGLGSATPSWWPSPNHPSAGTSDSGNTSGGLGLREIVLLCWLGVGILLVGWYGVRRAVLARRISGRRLVMTHPLADLLQELTALAGIQRPIRLTTSAALASPIALGASEIAVPEAALTELDRDQQRGMLAHELAHLTRRDPAWLTAASLAERVAFFQPLNRLGRRRIQESAEYLCDEWAVRRTGSEGGVSLATCLAKVAEWLDARPAVPVAGMAEERSHLVARVRRLLDGGPFPPGPSRLTLGLLAGMVVVAVTVALPAVSTAGKPLAATRGTIRENARETQPPSDPEQDSGLGASQAPGGLGSPGRQPASEPPVLAGGPTAQLADTNPAVVRALIEAARDPEVEVRRAALHSLRRFEDRSTIGIFREALRDADPEIRVTAIEALTEFKDRSVMAEIAALLRDENTEIRRVAIHALAELPTPSARAEIISALKDADAEVHQGAVRALAQLKDASAVEALTMALKDPKAEVRVAAVEALHELDLPNPPAGILDLLRDPVADVRHEAAHAVGHYQDARAVPILREMLTDPSPDVREAAVEALAEIRNEAAIEALVAALKSRDPNVRKAAAEALGQR